MFVDEASKPENGRIIPGGCEIDSRCNVRLSSSKTGRVGR